MDPLVAYIMSDSGLTPDNSQTHAPAHVLDVLYFFPSQTAARTSAASTFHPTLKSGEAYWMVLTTPAMDRDAFFWYRRAQQPPSPIAYRKQGEESWRNSVAFGAMLQVDGDSMVTPAEVSLAPRPATPLQETAVPAGVYRVGQGITPPRAIDAPDPKYTNAASRDKVQGTVVLWVIVGADGSVQNAGVDRSLRPDLDESALKTVRSWRFHPATKDGQPVPVMIHVEVNFRVG